MYMYCTSTKYCTPLKGDESPPRQELHELHQCRCAPPGVTVMLGEMQVPQSIHQSGNVRIKHTEEVSTVSQ